MPDQPQQLTVMIFAFPTEAASLQGFQATMRLIAGGSAYRLVKPGSEPFVLVVFALANAKGIERACLAAGGTPTSIAADMLSRLAERSAHAAERDITGTRHYEPGTSVDANLPSNPNDYRPKE